jgi:ABC-type phosphate/phosphonate transport system substrate-binding protein
VVRVSAWTAMTLLVVAVGLSRPAAARPPATIRLGVLSGMFRDVPPPLIHAAATPIRELFKKQTGLDGEVEVVEDHEALAAQMQAGKLHVGVFHGFEWAWVKDRHPDLVPMAITIPPRRPQAVIVVNAKSAAQAPCDLKGACVAVPLATKAHCHLFLERLAETLPAGTCGANRMPDVGPVEAMDLVVDGKAPAALLDVAALTAYQNNWTGKGAQLRTLAQSDPFPPTVIVYRKDAIGSDVAAKIQSGLVRTKDNSQGKAFLMLWKLKGFENVPAGYDAELRAVAARYPAPRLGMMAMPE